MAAPGVPNFPPVAVEEAHVDYDTDQPLYTVNGELGMDRAGDICHHFELHYRDVEIRSRNHVGAAQMGAVALCDYIHGEEVKPVVVKTLYRDLFRRRQDGLFRYMETNGEYRPTFEDPEMEAKIMQGLSDIDEILGCVNFVRRMNGPEEERHHYLIMPYAQGGDLLGYLNKNRFEGLQEQEIRRIFRHILKGVATLHSYGICHRDLSLENTLLTGQPQPIPMISDCAVADAFPLVPGFPRNNKRVGKPYYMAPEVRACTPTLRRSRSYDGHLADMYSLGIMLYMMVTFLPPRLPYPDREEMEQILSARGYSPGSQLADLIFKLMSHNPADRLTTLPNHNTECIFDHPWLAGHDLPVDDYDRRRDAMYGAQATYDAQSNQ